MPSISRTSSSSTGAAGASIQNPPVPAAAPPVSPQSARLHRKQSAPPKRASLPAPRRPTDEATAHAPPLGPQAWAWEGMSLASTAAAAPKSESASSALAPGAPEPRLTLTGRVILRARAIALLIEGQDKLNTLARALEDGPAVAMPIRAVLRGASDRLEIFTAQRA